VSATFEVLVFFQVIVALDVKVCAAVTSAQVWAVGVVNVAFNVPEPPVGVDGAHENRCTTSETVCLSARAFTPGINVTVPAWTVVAGPLQVCTGVPAPTGATPTTVGPAHVNRRPNAAARTPLIDAPTSQTPL
jgi:hypothetical protein